MGLGEFAHAMLSGHKYQPGEWVLVDEGDKPIAQHEEAGDPDEVGSVGLGHDDMEHLVVH